MAERLGLDCVAEGVETSHQSRILLQRGCTTAQGFFFSPALFPGDVSRMLEERRPDRPTDPVPRVTAAPAADPRPSPDR